MPNEVSLTKKKKIMPNHISTEITMEGNEKDLQAVRDLMKTKGNPFDFEKIVSLPKILEGTKSPMNIITQKEYKRQELIISIFETHKELEGDKLVSAMNNDLDIALTEIESSRVIYFKDGYSRCLTKKLSEQAINECGTDNWYEWQCEAWGTKWNSYEHWGLEEGEDGTFGFQTAWSHPTPIIEGLSEKFPNILFGVRFADEDFGSNLGTYTMKDGEIIENNFPDSGSDEAYELALDILGGEDYYLHDLFLDYSDEEDFDDYMECMMKLCVQEGGSYIDGDIPKWVLDKMLVMAVENEQYDVAHIIKGYLDTIKK